MKSEGKNDRFAINGVLQTLASSDIIGGLSNIADIAALLENNSDYYSKQEAGTLIKIQSERMAKLIEGLLTVEHVINGLIVPNPQPTSLKPDLIGVVDSLQPLSNQYSTKLKLAKIKNMRPVNTDRSLLITALESALEGIIRTTDAKNIKLNAVSYDDKFYLHITDFDSTLNSEIDKNVQAKASSSHTIAVPSFFVAKSLLIAMNGDLRIGVKDNNRHIDIIMPHTVQLEIAL